MLRPDDLALFLDAFTDVAAGDGRRKARAPADSLRRDRGLFAGDILRLSRSLDIAAELDRCPAEAAAVADIIGRASNEFRYAPIEGREAWKAAIRWAMEQFSLHGEAHGRPQTNASGCRLPQARKAGPQDRDPVSRA